MVNTPYMDHLGRDPSTFLGSGTGDDWGIIHYSLEGDNRTFSDSGHGSIGMCNICMIWCMCMDACNICIMIICMFHPCNMYILCCFIYMYMFTPYNTCVLTMDIWIYIKYTMFKCGVTVLVP